MGVSTGVAIEEDWAEIRRINGELRELQDAVVDLARHARAADLTAALFGTLPASDPARTCAGQAVGQTAGALDTLATVLNSFCDRVVAVAAEAEQADRDTSAAFTAIEAELGPDERRP